MLNRVMLTEEKASKWFHNLLLFLVPVFALYFGTVASVLQTTGHVINFYDFIPDRMMAGAFALYVINGLLDYLRKLK